MCVCGESVGVCGSLFGKVCNTLIIANRFSCNKNIEQKNLFENVIISMCTYTHTCVRVCILYEIAKYMYLFSIRFFCLFHFTVFNFQLNYVFN